jgi:hypothetical protein
MNEEQLNATVPSSKASAPKKKTMSPAAIAANRANALKSTGPRTPTCKLKAASNSLKHGLYAMRNFDHFIHDHDIALDVAINFIEQFNPVTPTEVALLHQLIHMQVRFLQTEYLYGQAMRVRVDDLLNKPSPMLPALLRELDRLPARIQRTIKTLRAEIAQREAATGENVEIEPIPNPPKLPTRPDHEIYLENPANPAEPTNYDKTNPSPSYLLAEQLVREFTESMNRKHGIQPEQPSEVS